MDREQIAKAIIFGVVAFFISFYVFKRLNVSGDRKELVVYAYSSFISKYGPGPSLASQFQKKCDCNVKYVNVGEAQMLIKKMETSKRSADLVLGFDNFSKYDAHQKRKWKSLENKNIPVPQRFNHKLIDKFIPYNWAPLSFIYRDEKYKIINSWAAIAKNKNLKIVVPDPRFSTTGLMFLYWIYNSVGSKDFERQLREIKYNLHSFPSSWSAAYGLFKQGEVDLAFSYLTSPAYHWLEELDYTFQPLVFKRHVVQIEYAAVPEACESCDLAYRYIQLMLSDFGQKTIMNKNFMYPINQSLINNTVFSELPEVKISDTNNEYEFVQKKEELINVWKKVFK